MTREWTKTRAGTRSKVNMVRYEAVNAMLLNEFLKRTAGSRNRKPAFEMKSTVARQEALIVRQQKQIDY